MTVPQSFRSALNGFNREDVVHYIEYINAKHNTEINQLRADVESLQNQLNTMTAAPDLSEEVESLRQERDALQETVAKLEEQLTAPATREQALEARCAELEAALEAAKKSAVQPVQNMAYELEAYRRAERTERMARERAEQVYSQTNSVLADATVKVDTAATEISQMADSILTQLNALQAVVTGSKTVLKDTLATM
jgi:chromosome segregation ATPase